MSRWQPGNHAGRRIQAGIPLIARRPGYERANGLQLRGVVTATYELDNVDHPEADAAGGVDAVAIYCDVLTYGSMWNQRFQMLRRVLVAQPLGSGMHRGKVWKPRSSKIDKTGNAIDNDRDTNPAELDGDHVLVTFTDDNLNQPIITASVPHPSADFGNEEKEPGHRLRLKVADGDPDFWKHHGAFYGISDDGDFVVDTTEAYAGEELDSGANLGKEKVPAEDGTTGNYRIKIPKGAKVILEIEGGASLDIDGKEADAVLTIGDGLKSAIIAEAWETFWDGPFKTMLLAITVPTGVGPSGTPINFADFPDYATASATSTKVKFPDG